MGQILVRNLDDRVIETLKRRASAAGRSLEAEVRAALTERAKLTAAEKRALFEEMQAEARSLINPDVEQIDSWILIREDRDRDHR